jgi:hypothetical protein
MVLFYSYLLQSCVVAFIVVVIIFQKRNFDKKWLEAISTTHLPNADISVDEQASTEKGENIDENRDGVNVNEAEIAVINVRGDINAITHTLRNRGFLLIAVVGMKDETLVSKNSQSMKYRIFLSLSQTIITKLAVQYDFSLKLSKDYTMKESRKLAVRSMDIIRRSNLKFEDIVLLHDLNSLKETLFITPKYFSSWSSYRVEEYFGAKVASFFAWIDTVYVYYLLPSSIIGLIYLWINRGLTNSITYGRNDDKDFTSSILCLATFFPMFSISFIEWWRQRYSFMSHTWDILKSEAEEEKEEKSSQQSKNKNTDDLSKSSQGTFIF